jgi:hypothetical protein
MALSILRRIALFQPAGKFVRNRFKPIGPDMDLDAFGKTLQDELKGTYSGF